MKAIERAVATLRSAGFERSAAAVEARRTEDGKIAELRATVRKIGYDLQRSIRHETRTRLVRALDAIDRALREHEGTWRSAK